MLPEISVLKSNDTILSQFGGLNHKESCQDNEFSDMNGMTSDDFPYMCSRQPYTIRSFSDTYEVKTEGYCAFDDDLYSVVYGTWTWEGGSATHVYLYKNNEPVTPTVELINQDIKRTLIKSGAYILIFPDNVMYNTQDGSVKSMDYYEKFDSHSTQDNSMYLSDKNGVPFVCDSTTTFTYAVDSSTHQPKTAVGFYNVIKKGDSYQSATDITTIIDEYINYSILNSTLDYMYKFGTIPLRNVQSNIYTGGVHPLNICLSRKSQIESVYDYTTYPLYYISTNTDREVIIQKYNKSQSAYLPIDLYVTVKTPMLYDDLVEMVNAGDFIKFYSYKSDDSEYEETDFSNKKSFWTIIKSFNEGLKIENIIKATDNKALLVFSNNQLELEKAFIDSKGLTFGSSQKEDTSYDVEIKRLSNFFGFGWGSSTDDRNLVYETEIAKEVPELDFIVSNANRLWGCSSDNHEIYSSKQGDPTSWYNYSGLATDSYAVTIASEGEFTGACVYNEMPFFFKENTAYAIMGNKPRNFQVQQYSCNGVESGAHNTICQKEGYVYYKSREGVERFNGSSTTTITGNLDLQGFKGYKANVCCDKYYISMGIGDDINLYVYDIKKGTWHKEYNLDQDTDLININQNLYLGKSEDKSNYLTKIIGKSTEPSWILNKQPTYDIPKWYVVSGEYNGGSLYNKYINKFMFELKMDKGAKLSISFSYNDTGEWEKVYRTVNRTNKQLIKIPIIPKRCERMKYKIEGEGNVKIYTITRIVEGGSEDGEYPY